MGVGDQIRHHIQTLAQCEHLSERWPVVRELLPKLADWFQQVDDELGGLIDGDRCVEGDDKAVDLQFVARLMCSFVEVLPIANKADVLATIDAGNKLLETGGGKLN